MARAMRDISDSSECRSVDAFVVVDLRRRSRFWGGEDEGEEGEE